MSSRFFKRRKMSSTSQAADEESNADGASSGQSSTRKRAFSTASGTAGSLPSRSYMHHPSHSNAVDVQYSSTGVREQTAEISSSFLSDSEMSAQFGRDNNHLETVSGPQRSHDIIAERTEPPTPDPEAFEQRPNSFTAVSHASDALQSYADDASSLNSGTNTTGRSLATRVPQVVVTGGDDDEDNSNMDERAPLLPRERLPSHRKQRYDSGPSFEAPPRQGIWNRLGHHYPSFHTAKSVVRVLANPKGWDLKQVASAVIVAPVKTLPAVFLGLLLNLLDALSYGIILFPLGEEVFSDLGADGVSMFYVSCIVSQLVYSSGSIFKGGVGSEMVTYLPS